MKWRWLVLLGSLGLGLPVDGAGDSVAITVQVDKPGARINPAMWGVFFEDINFGADGGLYAELVKNRSFEFPNPMTGWSPITPEGGGGALLIGDRGGFSAESPHYLRLTSGGQDGYGTSNEGFRGMGIREGESYDFSAEMRAAENASFSLRIEIIGGDGRRLGAEKLKNIGPRWEKRTAVLRASGTDPKARLQLFLEGHGTLDLDMVSLFPRHTWKERPGGLRADLVGALAELKPGFIRFPGGCIVEGSTLANRYQWKRTIGAPESRKLIINRWNNQFKHRPAPDYFQSFGLGFFEFFQLSEDLGAEPMPILNCGMACQFNTGELAPLNRLDSYVQDALDLIEFANGSPATTWGGRRAALGHPAPFNLKLLGVGNEQWGPQYFERYPLFAKAIKERYPAIQLIASAGPAPADERFQFAWSKLRPLGADIVDEHCYAAPKWFFENTRRYDSYDRNGPKVFMGEYAAQSVAIASPANRNNWGCALAEAAYMTGLERNADVVRMASYAPLFGHIDAWQWTPNLIWCDNLNVYGTPNYYVQQLFSRNRGDRVLPAQVKGAANGTGAAVNGEANPGGRFFATAALDEKSGEVILKTVNGDKGDILAEVTLEGLASVASNATVILLSSQNLEAENSFAEPKKIAPMESVVPGVSPRFSHRFPGYSLSILRFHSAPR